MGRLELALERPREAELVVQATQLSDDPGRDLDRVHPEVIERRMARQASDGAHVAGLALVAVGEAHPGRLADHAAERQRRQPGDQMIEQARHAFAADLLVEAERQVDGRLERQALKLRDQRQHGRDEALHVRGAAAVEPLVALGADERIARPVLAIHRHHVGMSGQHDPGHLRRADGGEQVGFGAGVVEDQIRDDAQPVEVVPHELDQREIGVAARRIEPDQSLEHLAPVQRGPLPHVILVPGRRQRRGRTIGSWRAPVMPATGARTPVHEGDNPPVPVANSPPYSVPRLGEGPASRRSIDRCSALPPDEASADGDPSLG